MAMVQKFFSFHPLGLDFIWTGYLAIVRGRDECFKAKLLLSVRHLLLVLISLCAPWRPLEKLRGSGWGIFLCLVRSRRAGVLGELYVSYASTRCRSFYPFFLIGPRCLPSQVAGSLIYRTAYSTDSNALGQRVVGHGDHLVPTITGLWIGGLVLPGIPEGSSSLCRGGRLPSQVDWHVLPRWVRRGAVPLHSLNLVK